MKTLKFNNNDSMPALGLGTWKSEPGEVYQAVKTAIKVGYRHVDCAPIYGNEKEVGRAIAESIKEGIVSRDELWVTSKLWNSEHAKEDVIPALKKTLKDLQLDYLNLYLIHWPVALKKGIKLVRAPKDFLSLEEMPLSETWKGMENAVNSGFTKHIGVSNFGRKKLETILASAAIKPEVNQVESHPYLQQKDLLNFCAENSIFFTAHSPLGSSDRPQRLKVEGEPKLLYDPLINTIANNNDITPAQVLICWALQRGASVIPKSINPGRIAQNLEAASLTLSDNEMKAIGQLEKNFRYLNGQFWVAPGNSYTLESLWS